MSDFEQITSLLWPLVFLIIVIIANVSIMLIYTMPVLGIIIIIYNKISII